MSLFPRNLHASPPQRSVHLGREAALCRWEGLERRGAAGRGIALAGDKRRLAPDGGTDDATLARVGRVVQGGFEEDGVGLASGVVGDGLPGVKEAGRALDLAGRGVPVGVHGHPDCVFDLAAKGGADAVEDLGKVIGAVDLLDHDGHVDVEICRNVSVKARVEKQKEFLGQLKIFEKSLIFSRISDENVVQYTGSSMCRMTISKLRLIRELRVHPPHSYSLGY